MVLHRQKPECISCHKLMDPLGFGMENFDGVGRWRENDTDGSEIDAAGELPSGEKFNGPEDLRKILVKRKSEFVRSLTTQLMTYALGRGLRADDLVFVHDSAARGGKERVQVFRSRKRNRVGRCLQEESRAGRSEMNRRLPRREVLKGIGAAVALPTLESGLGLSPLVQSAEAPKRLAFLFVPNGVHYPEWKPTSAGADYELTSILEPLAPVKKQFSVLTGLAQRNATALGDGPGDHARSAAAWLTGVHPKKTAGSDISVGISADQVAADAVGGATKFRSLELGCERGAMAGNCDSGYSCAYSSSVAWRGPSTPVAKEISPRLVFERLFGSGDKVEEAQNRAQRNGAAQVDSRLCNGRCEGPGWQAGGEGSDEAR